MKKLLSLLLMFLFAIPCTFTQNINEVFDSNECTWFGLDFSKVKMIGSEGFNNPKAIKDQFFESWNNLIINEKDKYNIGKAFKKEKVHYFLDVVEKRNEIPEVDELVINQLYSISEEDVISIIKEYNSNGRIGLGIVFIMESFDKHNRVGAMWVTLFDMNSNVEKPITLTTKNRSKVTTMSGYE